jgi:hypothetical protein
MISGADSLEKTANRIIGNSGFLLLSAVCFLFPVFYPAVACPPNLAGVSAAVH